ncbi:MAG TPA: ribosome-associated translation inhibitor RaiA [Solirubrobacteraceae bacterium]|jgi:putative sigma-54 modulation protein
MQIDIKGRNVLVTDEMRRRVERRLAKVARQVSPFARAELELFTERNPSIADSEVAEATLHLKGVTLRARECSHDMQHSLNLVADELARQVKRHREKRTHRREQRAAAMREARTPLPPQMGSPATG